MKRIANGVAKVLTFVLFVWLAREFCGFVEVDGCFDDGGAIDHAAGICVESRHGQWVLASARPFIGWLFGLGIPAVLAYGIWLTLKALAAKLVTKNDA